MASKPRVHELAKELGITSKEVLAKLQEIGEFVKSASSTVEAPVARKLRESFEGLVANTKDVTAEVKSSAAKTKPVIQDVNGTEVSVNKNTKKSNLKSDTSENAVEEKEKQTPKVNLISKPSPTPPLPKPPRMGNNPFIPRQVDNSKPKSRFGVPTPRSGGEGRNNPRNYSQTRPRPKNTETSTVKPNNYPSTSTNEFNPSSPKTTRAGGRSRGGSAAGAFGRTGSVSRKNKKNKRQKQQEPEAIQAPSIGGVSLPDGKGAVIKLPRGASITEFADKINANPAALVKALFSLGEMVTTTQSVSDDTLELLGSEMNYVVKIVSPEDEDKALLESFDLIYGTELDLEDNAEVRPPVVTIMGHVDHGKTRLLDTIRKTNVRKSEAGGITQHIGAYQVLTTLEGKDRYITFIDTPGHEAFTAMRARGAKSTDLAILVVAADDGVMPQTIEAINHAEAAGIPIVVAVNKIDKPEANPDKIRSQLTEYNLIAEEYGGQTMFVDISAKDGSNIDKLLEALLLTADATLDLRANPNIPAQGVAIEAHLDKGRGPVASIIIQRGTLKIGDAIVAGDSYGKVRKLIGDDGLILTAAYPSQPVQVVGFTSVPAAGDSFLVVEEDRIARQIADRRNARKRNAQAATVKKVSLEDLNQVLNQTSVLKLILKADNSGTVEALEEALNKINTGNEVQLQIINRGVGGVTETNVNLAAASNAIIIGFNVRAEGKATELANREGVEIRYYSVIYQAIEDIEKAITGLLKPIFEEEELGKAEIRALFRSSKAGNIAGCMVISGNITRGAMARLIRDDIVVAENLNINSLRREKDDVTTVKNGFECGLTVNYSDIKPGDIIQTYKMIEKAREL